MDIARLPQAPAAALHDRAAGAQTGFDGTLLHALNLHLLLRLSLLLRLTTTVLLLLLLRILRLILRLRLRLGLILISLSLLLLLRISSLLSIPTTRVRPSPLLLPRHLRIPARQIHIDPPLILLRPKAQPLLLTDPLHRRLNLLNVPGAMIPLSHNDMQMSLILSFCGADSRFEDSDCFVHELAVQIDGVGGNVVGGGVVGGEDVFGGLFVVGCGGGLVLFAHGGEGGGFGAVAGGVGLVGL